MRWLDETERHVRPGLALWGGAVLMLIGAACFSGYFDEVERTIRPPIRMEDAYRHLETWVDVTEVRFDCAQHFNFYASDRKTRTTYVVATSKDGTVAAIARYRDRVDCGALPARAIRGRFRQLRGSPHLASMRRSGLRIPEAPGPTLAFEMDLEPDDAWTTLGIGVVVFLTGLRAARYGLRRRRARSDP